MIVYFDFGLIPVDGLEIKTGSDLKICVFFKRFHLKNFHTRLVL